MPDPLIFDTRDMSIQDTSSEAVGTTYDFTWSDTWGGTKPKAAIVFAAWTGNTVPRGDGGGVFSTSIGMVDSNDNKACQCYGMIGVGVNTADCRSGQSNSTISGSNDTVVWLANTLSGGLYTNSMARYDAQLITNGIRFTKKIIGQSPYIKIQVILLGGEQLQNAKVVGINAFGWAIYGGPPYTDILAGFQPNLVFSTSAVKNFPNESIISGTGSTAWGWSAKNKGTGPVVNMGMSLNRRASADRFIDILAGVDASKALGVREQTSASGATTVKNDFEITAFTSSGATWDWSAGSGSKLNILYLELASDEQIHIGYDARVQSSTSWETNENPETPLVGAMIWEQSGYGATGAAAYTTNHHESHAIMWSPRTAVQWSWTAHSSAVPNFNGYAWDNADITNGSTSYRRMKWGIYAPDAFAYQSYTLKTTSGNEMRIQDISNSPVRAPIRYLMLGELIGTGVYSGTQKIVAVKKGTTDVTDMYLGTTEIEEP